jgi:hypothetical protein
MDTNTGLSHYDSDRFGRLCPVGRPVFVSIAGDALREFKAQQLVSMTIQSNPSRWSIVNMGPVS